MTKRNPLLIKVRDDMVSMKSSEPTLSQPDTPPRAVFNKVKLATDEGLERGGAAIP